MKQRIALFLACILCLACLVPAMAEEDGEETDTQEQYWIDSGREALWNTLNAEDGEGVPLTEEETAAFLSEYAGDYQMYDAEESNDGFFAIADDATFHAELHNNGEDTVVSGKITGVIRLSECVYALAMDDFDWEADAYSELVQNYMLFQVPGVTTDSGTHLFYETQFVANDLGFDPSAPSVFCLLTAFDSAPLWFRVVE